MNINEKIEHFKDISIQTASQQINDNLDKYKASLDEIFENHKSTTTTASKEIITNKKALIRRNLKMDFSNQETEIKRNLTSKTQNYKHKLFEEVYTLLGEFKSSPDYVKYLNEQITTISEFADGDDVTIYIDPADSEIKSKLSATTNTSLCVSDFSFGGGVRAVIPSRNILIDETFDSKISDIKENYRINY